MKRFLLLITWLVFPPAFFFMSKKFEFKLWERWVLSMLSPSTLLLLCILYITYVMWGLNNFADQIYQNSY